MLWGLVIFLGVIALVWLAFFLMPAQWRLKRFVYTTGMGPEVLNGAYVGDDVREGYAGDPENWPDVMVIVAGRNEGHWLEKTLGSLCAMDYPRFCVVFVDDQSTDNTAEVCRRLEKSFERLTVIHNTQSPRDGWVGKTWAVHQADAYMHKGDYLLFTDADLEFHPQCLKQMMRLALHRRTDIASILPSIRYETIGELLGLLSAMTLINSRFTLTVCNDPGDKRVLVAGGFLLVKREVYHALGGHAAVRGQVVEDMAFGMRAKAAGKRVFTALTHDLYTARMYEGWADTFRGLKKNAYAGANYSPGFAAVIALYLWFVGVMPPVYAAAGLWMLVAMPSPATAWIAVLGVGGLILQILVGLRTSRFVGFSGWTALTLPAGYAFYFSVFLGSVFDYYAGGNSWAGRRVVNARSLAEARLVEQEALEN